MAEPDELLTLADVARELQLATKTIRRAITAGRLKALRLGRQIRIRRRDLVEFLDQSELI